MNETVRMNWLQAALRVLAVALLAAFIPWITLILLDAPMVAPGGELAPLLRFQPYNAAYESMLAAVYVAWAATLWRASGNPAKHALFLDFTIWASVAHGLVMLIATPMEKGLLMTFIEGVPLFGIAGVLWLLRPDPGPPDSAPYREDGLQSGADTRKAPHRVVRSKRMPVEAGNGTPRAGNPAPHPAA